MTSLRYSLSHGTAQPVFQTSLSRFWLSLASSLVSSTAAFTCHFREGILLPATFSSLTCLCRLLIVSSKPSTAMTTCLGVTFFTFDQPTVTAFIIFLLHPQAGTSCFSQAVPLPTRHRLKSFSCTQICTWGSSLFFHMYLQTCKELHHKDTETSAHSIPSTYSSCLSAWAHLLLPTICISSEILSRDINIVLWRLNHFYS